jgi:hypothetical protein
VPGDTAAKVVQTKEPQHKDDFDERLARIICFAFSVPPQWATKVMNRATADNQSAQSEEDGLEPTDRSGSGRRQCRAQSGGDSAADFLGQV